MKRTRPRGRTDLSMPIRQRLNAYAIAAGAAGVSGMVWAMPAQAEIVYTPVHQIIRRGDVYHLDLTGSGVTDFTIREHGAQSTSGHVSFLFVAGEASNSVQGTNVGHAGFLAKALMQGSSIPAGKFSGKANAQMAFFCSGFLDCFMTTSRRGYWFDVSDRYLGLKFTIQGETHYGWARLSVKFSQPRLNAQLTGYAYETTPNKGIIAGQTSGTEEDASRGAARETNVGKHTTLAALALGSFDRSPWRREEPAAGN
jgi:hypothetical protein